MITLLAFDWAALWTSLTSLFTDSTFMSAITTLFNYIANIVVTLFAA